MSNRPDYLWIDEENNILYRRVFETEQVYKDIKIMSKDEFTLCYDLWIKGDSYE